MTLGVTLNSLVSCSDDKTIQIRQRDEIDKVEATLQSAKKISKVVMNDEAIIFSSGGTINVWDRVQQDYVSEFDIHDFEITDLIVYQDLLFSASHDSSVKVSYWRTGEIIAEFNHHHNTVNSIDIYGHMIASVSGGPSGKGTLKVWNWKTGESLRELAGYSGFEHNVILQGEVLFSGRNVWNWKTGKIIQRFVNYTAHVISRKVVGPIVVSISEKSLSIWNWKTEKILSAFKFDRHLSSLAVSDSYIFVGDVTGCIHGFYLIDTQRGGLLQ